MPRAHKRYDRNRHGERLQRAVDATVGHRIEHKIDELVARLIFSLGRGPAGLNTMPIPQETSGAP